VDLEVIQFSMYESAWADTIAPEAGTVVASSQVNAAADTTNTIVARLMILSPVKREARFGISRFSLWPL
jgi:hypothetical protein